MTIELTAEWEAFVRSQLTGGPYATSEDVLTAALMRLRDEQGQIDGLDVPDLSAIDEAERQIAAGHDRPC